MKGVALVTVMTSSIKNKIPAILKARGMTKSDFQRATGLSYPAAHKLATNDEISDETRVGTLVKVRDVLGISWDDLLED